MVAGGGMKLTVLMCCTLCLTVGKFYHGGWSFNEFDCLDVLVASGA
jgi:hypothetical protein